MTVFLSAMQGLFIGLIGRRSFEEETMKEPVLYKWYEDEFSASAPLFIQAFARFIPSSLTAEALRSDLLPPKNKPMKGESMKKKYDRIRQTHNKDASDGVSSAGFAYFFRRY